MKTSCAPRARQHVPGRAAQIRDATRSPGLRWRSLTGPRGSTTARSGTTAASSRTPGTTNTEGRPTPGLSVALLFHTRVRRRRRPSHRRHRPPPFRHRPRVQNLLCSSSSTTSDRRWAPSGKHTCTHPTLTRWRREASSCTALTSSKRSAVHRARRSLCPGEGDAGAPSPLPVVAGLPHWSTTVAGAPASHPNGRCLDS